MWWFHPESHGADLVSYDCLSISTCAVVHLRSSCRKSTGISVVYAGRRLLFVPAPPHLTPPSRHLFACEHAPFFSPELSWFCARCPHQATNLRCAHLQGKNLRYWLYLIFTSSIVVSTLLNAHLLSSKHLSCLLTSLIPLPGSIKNLARSLTSNASRGALWSLAPLRGYL